MERGFLFGIWESSMSGRISAAFPQHRIGCCKFVLNAECTARLWRKRNQPRRREYERREWPCTEWNRTDPAARDNCDGRCPLFCRADQRVGRGVGNAIRPLPDRLAGDEHHEKPAITWPGGPI